MTADLAHRVPKTVQNWYRASGALWASFVVTIERYLVPRVRPVLSVSAAVGLSALLVAVPFGAAFAASQDVSTPSWLWEIVEDNGFTISDASSAPSDVLGTGLDFDYGWTGDAFDGFFGSAEVELGGSSQSPTFVIADPAQWVDDGRTLTTGRVDVDFGESQLRIIADLEIEGSFARWTFSYEAFGVAALSDYEVRYQGDLGSDDDTTYIAVGTDGLVSHDLGWDPVIGYQLGGTASSFSFTQLYEYLVIEAVPTEDTVLTLALQDYDFCNQSAAIADMQARVPTLAGAFGTDLPVLLSDDCATAEPYSPAAVGVTVNQSLLVTASDFVNADGDAFDDWGYFYFDTDETIEAVLVDGPAGLTVDVTPGADDSQANLVLGGTLTEALTGPVTILLYTREDGDGVWVSYPLQLVLQPSGELAATGAADSVALGVLTLVLFGSGAALVFARRRSVWA